MYRYERSEDVTELRDIISDIQYELYDIGGGRKNDMETIRENVENIRAWGQEWKNYAKRIDPKIPDHQKPENLPKWGSLT